MTDARVRERLHEGLAALPFAVSDGQAEQMLAYLALLNRWNAVHNLTAVRDPLAQVSVHVLDSLSLLPFVGEDCRNLADVGSGAGLPALMLAIMRPEMMVFAVEASHKKAAFIRQAAIRLQLGNVEVVAKRVEDWQPERVMDVLVSRAMSSLALFLRLTRHLGDEHSRWLICKGPAEDAGPVEGFVVDAPCAVQVPLLQASRFVYCATREGR